MSRQQPPKPGHDRDRQRVQRSAAHSARLVAQRRVRRAGRSRVSRDHAIDQVFRCEARDGVELLVAEVRSELGENWHWARARSLERLAAGMDSFEDRQQVFAVLEFAQTGRVGRGQIQGYIVGDGRDSRKTEFVVVASILDRSVAILADVHAADSHELPASQVFHQAVDAKIIEAETVHQGAAGRIAEYAWPRIGGLRSRSDGAYFDEAESDCGKTVDADSIFVEPGGYPDPVRKAQ